MDKTFAAITEVDAETVVLGIRKFASFSVDVSGNNCCNKQTKNQIKIFSVIWHKSVLNLFR
jgi:hypothetical protein